MRIIAVLVALTAIAHLRLLYDEPRLRIAARHGIGFARGTWAQVCDRTRRLARRPIVGTFGVGLLVGLVWSATYWRLTTQGDAVTVLGINDYPKHQWSAHELQLIPLHLNVPQFLYHLVTKATVLAFGVRVGDVASMVLFTALAYVGVVLLMREPSRDRGTMLDVRASSIAGAAYFLLESPALVAIWLRLIPSDTPFSTIHWWGNPTYLAALPFAFLALPLLNLTIDASEADLDGAGSWRRCSARWKLLLAVALGTAAKPAFTLVLLPALPVYLLVVRRAHLATQRRLATWALTPMALVMAWQTWFLRTGQSPDFQSSWTFDPLVEPIYGWAKAVPVYLFPVILVALASWASQGSFLRERSVQIVLVACAFALPLMLTVRETGNKSGEGNMAVPMQACTSVLLLLVFRTLTWELIDAWRSRREAPGRVPARAWVSAATLAMLLAGGIASLLDGSGLIHVYANWELQYQGT